jgi:transposase
MSEFSVYVGLDVHKATIAVAVAAAGRGKPVYRGEIANTPSAIKRLMGKLSPDGEVLGVCYESGPCGYGLHRQITAMGHDCIVVAPGLIPRRATDRIKTDRRDALTLARPHRAGELTPVWVPDAEQEAMRDLTRAREDIKAIERTARQRLGALLLRHGHVYTGKSRWTQTHFRWLERITMPTPVQQIVLQEYVDTVVTARRRVAALTEQMRQTVKTWTLHPVVEALMALCGVSLITAMTVLAELGNITRFASPSQLMAYLGLVPSERSSGGSKHQGGITKTGNGHVRRVLVEAAWAYRFPARKSPTIQRRAQQTNTEVQTIAWQAQKRLCGCYRHLISAGKNTSQATTAVARELAGFIWAIACEVPVPAPEAA